MTVRRHIMLVSLTYFYKFLGKFPVYYNMQRNKGNYCLIGSDLSVLLQSVRTVKKSASPVSIFGPCAC